MRRVERIVTTDDKQKLPPPPTVSAEAVEEARAAASSTWGIPKDEAKPSVGAPVPSAGNEATGVPAPITRATEVFDALLADVSAPIPVGVQTRRKAALPDAAGASEQIVATRLHGAASTSAPSTTEAAQERPANGQRWMFAAGGLVLGIVIGLAIGRSPDPPERPSVARQAPAQAPTKLDAPSANKRAESKSVPPLPPAVSYPEDQEKARAPRPAPAPEPQKTTDPTSEPVAPDDQPPAPAADPTALGGVTDKGTFIDELVVGDGDKKGSCTSPRNSFSIAKDERAYACFHIMHPREGDRLTVRWRKDGDTKRRSFFPMNKSVEATRTRAFMRVREGYEGSWSIHVSGPNGTELASAKFTIVP
jgi:hypothetical protein